MCIYNLVFAFDYSLKLIEFFSEFFTNAAVAFMYPFSFASVEGASSMFYMLYNTHARAASKLFVVEAGVVFLPSSSPCCSILAHWNLLPLYSFHAQRSDIILKNDSYGRHCY